MHQSTLRERKIVFTVSVLTGDDKRAHSVQVISRMFH